MYHGVLGTLTPLSEEPPFSDGQGDNVTNLYVYYVVNVSIPSKPKLQLVFIQQILFIPPKKAGGYNAW